MEYRFVDVVEIGPSDLDRLGGRDWREVLALVDGKSIARKSARYGDATLREEAQPSKWTPPNVIDWLPLDRAWLRCVEGRAFLYLQNW